MTENTSEGVPRQWHWLCVGEVTPAAMKRIREGGGACLALPSDLGAPPLIVARLPADLPDGGICFWDESYSLHITLGDRDHATVTLYSKNIMPALAEESIDLLVLATPDEWKAYKARRIAESQEKYAG
jgi:hypothetical protein